jgi:hypothetical protein
MARLRQEGLGHIPVVVGGIIPPDDENVLRNIGVAAIYTPKDYAMDEIMKDIVRIVARAPRAPDDADVPRPAARRVPTRGTTRGNARGYKRYSRSRDVPDVRFSAHSRPGIAFRVAARRSQSLHTSDITYRH